MDFLISVINNPLTFWLLLVIAVGLLIYSRRI